MKIQPVSFGGAACEGAIPALCPAVSVADDQTVVVGRAGSEPMHFGSAFYPDRFASVVRIRFSERVGKVAVGRRPSPLEAEVGRRAASLDEASDELLPSDLMVRLGSDRPSQVQVRTMQLEVPSH